MSSINKRIQFIKVRKNGRTPSNYPQDGGGAPMRITRMFPMKLKDITLEKLHERRPESEVVCITEMMSLFECFEKSDYNATTCQQQAKQLEQCYSSHMNRKAEVNLKRRLKD